MLRTDHKKAQAAAKKSAGQAATELAVFGAIIIFLLGTIVRTAVSNSYMQNQDFKAMRMALLASWQGTTGGPGNPNACMGCPQNTSHNNSQVLFLEDRLSPDYNKYGDMDRTPFIASGSGTFTYNLMYPISDSTDVINSLPFEDVWINGQHFPFTLASYNPDYAVVRPSLGMCSGLASTNPCKANQCFRQYREWSGGLINENTFISPTVAPYTPITGTCSTMATTSQQRTCQEGNNACTIFSDLYQAGVIDLSSGVEITGGNCAKATGALDPSTGGNSVASITSSAAWSKFVSGNKYSFETSFPGLTSAQYNGYFNAILSILQPAYQYPLFYTITANPGSNAPAPASGAAEAQFSTNAPTCTSHPCMYDELSQDVPLLDYYGYPTTDASGNSTNVNGVMQYDLLRMGYYSANDSHPPPCASGLLPPSSQCLPVDSAGQFPLPNPPNACATCQRNYMAWQWSATAGTTAAMIGLNTSNSAYPTWDIDGRLKQVVIYKISQTGGSPPITHVAFEDPEGGDLDQTWDTNSCGPKPGLQQSQVQIFTFTENGTYLLMKEGKLFNPESGQVVRSVNKRDNIDLIQRSVQLSNNTGRFCTTNPSGAYAGTVSDGTVITYPCTGGGDCASPNPVEVCANENPCNCFMGGSAGSPTFSNCGATSVTKSGMTVAQTCYDTLQNVIYIRSRLQDLSGRSWMTNVSGQLKVQQ